MRVRSGFGFFLAEENDEEQPEDVKRRQRGDEHGDAKQQVIFLFQGLREDGVLLNRNR